MNNNAIKDLLRKKLNHSKIELPSYIEFDIINKTLYIKFGKRYNKGKLIYSCCENVQSDEAAFEGWAVCFKYHLSELIEQVSLNWEEPLQSSENEKLHYYRFLYRVVNFKKLFDWFYYDKSKTSVINSFSLELKSLTINTPLSKASAPSTKSAKEKQIEYAKDNLEIVKKFFKLKIVNHQLPVGVKKDSKSFFTGGASAIDIWGIDEENRLNIFELKYSNKKVGIVSELLFYTYVMYDVFISKEINKPNKVKDIRDALHLYGNCNSEIIEIKSFFLADKLHPLVEGVTQLLNTNKLGLKFFNALYKINTDNLLFSSVYLKSGFQLETQIKQTSFRIASKLKGNNFMLKNEDDNFFEDISSQVQDYFKTNEIDWWTFNRTPQEPTKHLLSSQIQCLNFLFALRNDKVATLKLAQLFDADIDAVLPTLIDKEPAYIAFEFTYENEKLLGENDKGAKRGAFCTSIDALIVAIKKGKKILLPIEWKFTEQYIDGINKALDGNSGKKRQSRYNKLIKNSKQLKWVDKIENSAYYYEPFYELMRQSLLVEQMVSAKVADDFLHIMVASAKNTELLGKQYDFSDENLKTIWRACLQHQEKFKIVDSKQILQLIETLPSYTNLATYLKKRYFE